MCRSGKFHLCKFKSASSKLLESLPKDDTNLTSKILDLDLEDDICEKTLGINWSINSDKFSIGVSKVSKSYTKHIIILSYYQAYYK